MDSSSISFTYYFKYVILKADKTKKWKKKFSKFQEKKAHRKKN